MSLRRCSTTSGEAPGPRELWRSVHDVASAPSGPAVSGIIAAITVKNYRCVVAVVAVTAVVAAWPLVQQNQLSLEREVASTSVSYP
jgi:hypothetical protein